MTSLKTRQRLGIVWSGFAIVFLGFTAYHLRQASGFFPAFVPPAVSNSVQIMGVDPDQHLADFVVDFNDFLFHLNNSNASLNYISAAGYGVAALTAVFSAMVEFVSGSDHPDKVEGGHSGSSQPEPDHPGIEERERDEAAQE